jgi:hypothetical protein
MRDEQTADSPDYGLPDGKSVDEFLEEVKTRAQECFDAYSDLYEKAIDDIRFCDIPGNQWDDYTKQQRVGRPCYEFNKVAKVVALLTGDQKQNRPTIKVRANRDATEDDAEIRMGLIRNIEAISNAEQAYDTAFDFAVKGGYGVWRIKTAYEADDAFDQEIRIEPFEDPFCTYPDPAAVKFDRRDARFWFVFEVMTRSQFKARYPKAEVMTFGAGARTDSYDWNDWWGEQTVRVAEYWYKVPATKEIVLLSDGSTVDADKWDEVAEQMQAAGLTEEQRRTVESPKVYSCVVSGSEILEKPTLWAGSNIPLVPVWGQIIRLEGKDYWQGAVRAGRDPQKLYNYERTTLVEVIAKQPKQPLLAAAEAVEGYEADYQSMGHSDKPVLLYNHLADHPGGGMPQRVAPPAFPVALANAANMSAGDIRDTMGMSDANFGEMPAGSSGRALNSQKRQGDVANFVYTDNLAKAMRFTGEQLLELIPIIYDTHRQIRILGQDGAEKIVQINRPVVDQATQQTVTLNDLSAGKFDVTVDIGPSYATQRMETAEAMSQMSQVPGPFQPLAQYLYLKSLDVPDIDEVQDAARAMLVKQGLLQPNDGEAPPTPPQPNPEVVAKANLAQAQAGKAQAETARTQVETQQMAAMGPLNAQHVSALTAKEAAHAISKIPPLPPDPTLVQPPNNATLPLAPPGQF